MCIRDRGKTAKSILISCGARLAVFDIAELREVTAYDELALDTLGDRKTALFLIMSDTDYSFNFLISMCYTQLDVYKRQPQRKGLCLQDEAGGYETPRRTGGLNFVPTWDEVACR